MAYDKRTLGRRLKSLRSLLRSAEDLIKENFAFVPPETLQQICDEVLQAEADLPKLLPSSKILLQADPDNYMPETARTYLRRAVAAIESELDEGSSEDVVGPTLDFKFIQEKQLRTIVERDYPELLVAFSASCKKSALVLAGSVIEAILLDFVLQNRVAAVAVGSAPKSNDPLRWTLEDLINVSAELKPELLPLQTMSHGVRRYRNLVHPAVEMKSPMKVEIEEARVAISLVRILHRELA